ncbi:MAG: helix-turn-helix domain-containing protein [Christensenellales bacterium]|jgi:hypothetical protein
MSQDVKTTLFAELDDILFVHDLQRILKISRKKVYELLDTGAIKSVKPGKAYIIAKDHLIDYIMGQKT